MNISSIHESNSSGYQFSNGTEAETGFKLLSGVYFICILIGLPPNFYVIWLIVRGAGNKLAAEFFILNLSACEIILCVQCLLFFLGYCFQISWEAVIYLDGFAITGYPLFQCLICVERYLAVVHPVIFLRYKHLRYKLMCSAVTWVAAFASGGINTVIWLIFHNLFLSLMFISFLVFLFIQLFCCLAVLRALKQSGPGERGREREEENHMKKRAFNLILINTVTTVIIYVPYTILAFITKTHIYHVYMGVCEFCYILAGLVQPVLFLNRVGKLNVIKCH